MYAHANGLLVFRGVEFFCDIDYDVRLIPPGFCVVLMRITAVPLHGAQQQDLLLHYSHL